MPKIRHNVAERSALLGRLNPRWKMLAPSAGMLVPQSADSTATVRGLTLAFRTWRPRSCSRASGSAPSTCTCTTTQPGCPLGQP